MSLRSQITSTLLIFLLPFTSIRAEDDEIRVELSTKQAQASLYLGQIVAERSQLNKTYLDSVRKTLLFDLNYSGYSKVSPIDENLEKTLAHAEPQVAFNYGRWEKTSLEIILKAEAVDNKLDLYAYNIRANTLKKFEGILLTGDLAHDRMQMHKLSAALLKTLFGVEAVTNSRILYSVQKEGSVPSETGWKAEIWECDYDGNNPKQITYEDNYSITPVFIPPHPAHGNSHYLYVNYKNGQPKIYYSSLDSKTGKPLVNLRGNQLLPAICKDRNKMAFISDAGGRADLFLQEVDDKGLLVGKPKQLFSYPRSTQASPTFDPSGSQIAFVSDKDGTPRIYLIPVASENGKRANPTLLTKKNRENTCPNWSPDGTKLAYSAKTNGVRQIWIYDFSAEEEQQLTTGQGNKENPVWAQDSLHIIFNSTDPDHSELYLVNLNQPEAVKLTSGPGKKHYPTWGTR